MSHTNVSYQYFYQKILCGLESGLTSQSVALDLPAQYENVNVKLFALFSIKVENSRIISLPNLIPDIPFSNDEPLDLFEKIVLAINSNDMCISIHSIIHELALFTSLQYKKVAPETRPFFVENVLLDAFRNPLLGYSKEITVTKLTDIPALYKVFERC